MHLSYLPNHLSTFSLWKLWGDFFFHQAESNIQFQQKISIVTKLKLIATEEILLVLKKKLIKQWIYNYFVIKIFQYQIRF